MDLDQGFEFGDLRAMIRRRAGSVAAVGGAAMLFSVFVAAVMPNQYESYATLLVEPQSISQEFVDTGLPQQDLNNRLHLIQMQILSRGRLSRMIDDLSVYPEESQEMTREEVIDLMRSHISVMPVLPELETEARAQAGVRGTELVINTFRIAFRHSDKQTASDIANRLANDFIDQHIRERVQLSGDTSEFIDAELNSIRGRIAEVEQEIAAVKAANAGSLPEDLIANQRLLERAVEGLRQTRRELALAESDEAFFRQQTMSGAGTDSFAYRNNMTPERRMELLEVQLAEYQARGFTEKHPDVVAARGEIVVIREELSKTEGDGSEPNLSLAQQNARAEEQRAGLRAAAGRREIEQLQEQVEEVEARLAATPRVAEQLDALEREYQHLFENYQEYSTKRLEAEVAASMERRQKGEQFRVLEAAYPAIEPVSPNRPLVIVLGAILGLGLGGGLALMLEASDSSYHASQRLQDEVRIPVLASIPEVMLASDLAARRQAQQRRALLAATVAGLVLFASLVGNWWVNGAPGAVTEIFSDGGSVASDSGSRE